MQYNKVEICGINTSQLKVLKEKEKMELLKKAQAGDKNARNELIEGNLRLVLSVVQRFSNRGENMDDLFQVGVIGLIKAIDNFNTNLDVRFSTYAVPMCIGEIRRYLRDDNPVRVSRSMRDTAYKAMQIKEQLINEQGKEPTIEQIANRLDMKKSDVVLALEAIVDPVSLYEPVYNDGGDTIYLADQLEDKSNKIPNDTRIALKQAMDNLKEKEKYIIIERYLKGRTQLELASEIGISQAQISRLEKSGLKTIKKMME